MTFEFILKRSKNKTSFTKKKILCKKFIASRSFIIVGSESFLGAFNWNCYTQRIFSQIKSFFYTNSSTIPIWLRNIEKQYQQNRKLKSFSFPAVNSENVLFIDFVFNSKLFLLQPLSISFNWMTFVWLILNDYWKQILNALIHALSHEKLF